MTEPKDAEYFRKDVRNIVWGVGFVALRPSFVVLMMMSSGDGSEIKWDPVTFGLLGYSITLADLAIIAGVQCGQGKKRGRMLPFSQASWRWSISRLGRSWE